VRLETAGPGQAAFRGAVPVASRNASRIAPGPRRRIADTVVDVLTVVGVVLAVPFVILGIGVPLALVVRLILWILRLL
jgi:hypothetical protein